MAIRLAGVVLIGIGWLAACTGEPLPDNLLLITVDTLRADRLACYGGESDVGVAVCALADDGVRFTWALSPAPYTAPAIASLLTSSYPVDHGVGQSAVSYLAEDAVTVAEVLANSGYTTAAFVSNPVLDPDRHLQQGFEIYDHRMTRTERNRPGLAERDARDTTDAALAWAEVGAEEPWFLWVHYQDPHGPYEPPDAAPEHDEPGAAVLDVLDDNTGLGGIPAYQALPGVRSVDAYARRYATEIRHLDAHLGRLVAGLDALGSRPAVLLTSDHGEAFGEDDFYFAHGHSVALDQIRVPLLWRPSRPAEPTTYTKPVSVLDVAPTLLRAAGVAAPASFRGRPLPVDAGADDDPGADRAIYAEHTRRAAVVLGRAYFARDRVESSGPAFDPVTGGDLPALPARGAVLRPDGGVGEPGDPGATRAALEPLLETFFDRAPATATRHDDVPRATRDRLRALGYLD